MNRFVFTITNLFFLFFITGCATVDSVKSDLKNSSDSSKNISSRYFSYRIEVVTEITLNVMRDYGLDIKLLEDANPDDSAVQGIGWAI